MLKDQQPRLPFWTRLDQTAEDHKVFALLITAAFIWIRGNDPKRSRTKVGKSADDKQTSPSGSDTREESKFEKSNTRDVIPSDVNDKSGGEEDRGVYPYLLTPEFQYQQHGPARPGPQTQLDLTKIKIQHKG